MSENDKSQTGIGIAQRLNQIHKACSEWNTEDPMTFGYTRMSNGSKVEENLACCRFQFFLSLFKLTFLILKLNSRNPGACCNGIWAPAKMPKMINRKNIVKEADTVMQCSVKRGIQQKFKFIKER